MPNLLLNRRFIIGSLAVIAIACGSSTDGKTGLETGDGGLCLNGVCTGGTGTGTGGTLSGTGSTTTTGGSVGTGGTVSLTCGNGAIEAGEDCDGAALGGATCASATANAMPNGVLSCSPTCTFDFSQCSSGGNVGGAGGTGSGGSGGTVGTGGATTGCGAIACTRNRTCLNAGCTVCSASGFCQ